MERTAKTASPSAHENQSIDDFTHDRDFILFIGPRSLEIRKGKKQSKVQEEGKGRQPFSQRLAPAAHGERS